MFVRLDLFPLRVRCVYFSAKYLSLYLYNYKQIICFIVGSFVRFTDPTQFPNENRTRSATLKCSLFIAYFITFKISLSFSSHFPIWFSSYRGAVTPPPPPPPHIHTLHSLKNLIQVTKYFLFLFFWQNYLTMRQFTVILFNLISLQKIILCVKLSRYVLQSDGMTIISMILLWLFSI